MGGTALLGYGVKIQSVVKKGSVKKSDAVRGDENEKCSKNR